MAELLIRARAPFDPNNTIQDIGDIVAIRPDGWIWGNAECLPEYIRVKLTNVEVETLRQFLKVWEEILEISDDGLVIKTNLLKRRKYKIPEAAVQNAVAAGGTYIISTTPVITQFVDDIIDKAMV